MQLFTAAIDTGHLIEQLHQKRGAGPWPPEDDEAFGVMGLAAAFDENLRLAQIAPERDTILVPTAQNIGRADGRGAVHRMV